MRNTCSKTFQQSVQEIVDTVYGCKYNSIVYYDQLLEIAGFDLICNSFHRIIAEAKRRLVPLGKAITTVPKKGYRVIHPVEYKQTAAKLMNKAAKCTDKALTYFNGCEIKKLNPEQNKHHTELRQFFIRAFDLKMHQEKLDQEMSTAARQTADVIKSLSRKR